MPSFQQAQMPYHYSDYASRYGPANYGSQEYHGPSASFYHNSAAQDLVVDPYDRYKHSAGSAAPMYGLPNAYVNAHMNMPAPIGPHMLPPVRNEDRYTSHQPYNEQRRQYSDSTQQNQQPKEEKAVGGVSAKLDYDMEQMTDFVAEMTVGMYDIYKSRICIADIDLIRSIKPGMSYPSSFRKWVLQVLNATRLPSATILLSLSYLTLRVRGLSAKERFVPTERSLYQLLTVALILGSKFLDDNTFQNKSWAEVSNISVVELNKDEREWLEAFNHRLHFDSDSPDGYSSWAEQWVIFKARATSLYPSDGSLPRQRSLRQTMTPSAYQQPFARPAPSNTSRSSDNDGQYNGQSYSPYGPWFDHRSGTGIDTSPSTAPHTGPNTPDYYGARSGWGHVDSYAARQQQYALASMSQFSHQMPAHPAAYQTPNFSHGGGMWNCHSAACQCSGCRSQNHFMQPRYGPIVVG